MTTDSCTLAEISYDIAAKMFPSVPSKDEQASSLYVSEIDSAQKDYLLFLNRSLNAGEFSATHIITKRSFVVGKDVAEDDSSDWLVDAENVKVAYRLIVESLPIEMPNFEGLASHSSEPLRRLRRLKNEFGGTFEKEGSNWKFSKVAELAGAETQEGRGRSSEKTVRGDLIKAASLLEASRRSGEYPPRLGRPKKALANPFSGL